MKEQFSRNLSMGSYYAWLESVPGKGLSSKGELVDPTHPDWFNTDFKTEEALNEAIELYEKSRSIKV